VGPSALQSWITSHPSFGLFNCYLAHPHKGEKRGEGEYSLFVFMDPTNTFQEWEGNILD